MAKSETLRIKIETDGDGKTKASLAGVEKGLIGVDGAAKKSAGGIDLSAVALKSFAALAAAKVATSLVNLARNTIDSAAAFDDMAKAAGISSTKLFQVAQLNGRSASEMSGALFELTQNMRTALADGTSAAATHFRALGVSVTDANGNMRASDEVLADIAQRFASAPDGPAKTAFAMELLGKRSAALIPILNTLDDDMRRVGDGMSAEFAGASSEFNKNVAQMEVELQNLIARGLNPAVQSLNQFFLMARGGDTEVRRVATAIAHWEGELKKAGERYRELGGVMAKPTTIAAATEMRELSTTIATAQTQLAALRARYDELGGTVKTTQLTPPDAAQAKQKKEAADAAARYRAGLERTAEAIKAQTDPAYRMNKELALYDELLNKNLLTVSEWATATSASWEEFNKTMDTTGKELDDFTKQAAEDLKTNLSDTFYGAMTGRFEDVNDAFRDMLRKMLADAVAAQITKAIFGDTGKKDESNWISTGISWLASALGGGASAKATGGDVGGGRPYLVGEQGPELMVPGASGTVIPNHRLGGGGVTINQSFDFRGAQPGESLRLRAEADRIKAETIATFYAQIERGGAAARVVGRR